MKIIVKFKQELNLEQLDIDVSDCDTIGTIIDVVSRHLNIKEKQNIKLLHQGKILQPHIIVKNNLYDECIILAMFPLSLVKEQCPLNGKKLQKPHIPNLINQYIKKNQLTQHEQLQQQAADREQEGDTPSIKEQQYNQKFLILNHPYSMLLERQLSLARLQYSSLCNESPVPMPHIAINYETPKSDDQQIDQYDYQIPGFPKSYMKYIYDEQSKALTLNKPTIKLPIKYTESAGYKINHKMKTLKYKYQKIIRIVRGCKFDVNDEFLIMLIEFHKGDLEMIIQHLNIFLGRE